MVNLFSLVKVSERSLFFDGYLKIVSVKSANFSNLCIFIYNLTVFINLMFNYLFHLHNKIIIWANSTILIFLIVYRGNCFESFKICSGCFQPPYDSCIITYFFQNRKKNLLRIIFKWDMIILFKAKKLCKDFRVCLE